MKKRFLQLTQSAIVRNASWLLVEKALLLGGGFVFLMMLSRYWGVEQLGDYQYLLAIVALLTPFSSLGLNSLVSGELVKQPEQEGIIIGTALILRAIGSAFGLLVGLLVCVFLVDGSLQLILLILLLAQWLQLFSVIDFFFEAKVMSRVSALIRSSVGLSFMVFKLAAVFYGAQLYQVLLLTVIEWLILAVFWLAAYQHFSSGLTRLVWSKEQAMFFIKRCGWLFLSSIAAVIYLKIDQVMLGQMLSNQTVAFYSVASRFSEVWYLVPGIIVASIYPKLMLTKQAQVAGDVGAGYRQQLQQWCDRLCWLAILIALAMSLAAPMLIVGLFGDNYSPSIDILQIHIWAGVFIFMRALFSKWILIEDLPRYSLLTHGLGAVINVLLNILFIPLFEAQGAALATLISYAVASYGALFLFKATRPMAWIMSRSLIAPIFMLHAQIKKG